MRTARDKLPVSTAEAKRQIFGDVGIDLLAGPTEILIIADRTADPYILAADLLGQAEHDPNSRQSLISLSKDIAEQTVQELEKQLKTLPTRKPRPNRGAITAKSWWWNLAKRPSK
jgi:histidinol dehydrogenase